MPARWVVVMQRRLFLTALLDGVLFVRAAGMAGASVLGLTSGEKTVNQQQHLKLFLAGDVMTGRGVDQILPHPGKPVLHEDFVKDARRYVRLAERTSGPIPKPVDYRYIWGDALDARETHDPDLRIVNLETSITASDEHWPAKGIHYRMHPRNVACLTEASLDCCVLANNHAMDWGHAGLEETLATLRSAGIETAGAGGNIVEAARPARLSVPGKGDVLVFAVADTSSGVPDTWLADQHSNGIRLLDDLSLRTAGQIGEHIASEKLPGDIVVLSIHWGGNWGYRVPMKQRRFARHLIDTGAVDIVHGHSSHHPKAIEGYKGKAIIYGCGDFITDYEGIGGHERYRPWLAPMYFVTLNLHSRLVERLEIELLRLQRFQLTRASARDRRWLRDKLNEYGEEFATIIEGGDDTLVARPYAAGHQGGGDEHSKYQE